jgi:hypothetical protein
MSFTCCIPNVALYDYVFRKWKLEQANNPNLLPFIEWVKNVVHGPGLGFRWALIQWRATIWMRCSLQFIMFISCESSLTLWIFSSYHDFYDLYISLTSKLKCKCWISIELEAKAKSMCMNHEHSQRSVSWWCCCNKPKNI